MKPSIGERQHKLISYGFGFPKAKELERQKSNGWEVESKERETYHFPSNAEWCEATTYKVLYKRIKK